MEKIYDLEWKEKYVDGVKHMEEIIAGEEFAELHVLDMYYCEIGVEGAKYFKEMTMSKPMKFLQELNLSGNALTDDGFSELIESMVAGSFPEIVYINVDDNKLTIKSMESLKKLIQSKACPKLEAVSLNLNDLGEEGAKAFAQVLEMSPIPWSRINLNENHINDGGMNAILDVLQTRSENVYEFAASQCGLSTACINRIASFLSDRKFPHLAVLDLSYNYSDDMLDGLLDGLSRGDLRFLRRLVLSGMCMEASGCKKLSNVLRSRCLPCLQELIIAENNIREKGVLAVLLALRETACPVRVLDLSWNDLTDEGAKYLINFLNGKSKTSLAVILLNQNDIAFKITDLQRALNQRGIMSPKLREQWL